jgi:TetR/AcrR family tetracycline transcriptional repressor
MSSIPRRRQGPTIPVPPAAPSRVRLTRERIVQVALDLMDEVGLDDLTMRRLATELNVQAAALYRHVRNKDELLNEMADALCAEAVTPDPSLPWTDQLRALARDQLRLLRSRRDAARLIAGTMPVGPERLRLIDFTLGTLLGAGFDGDEAFQIALLLTNFVTGAVLEEASNPATAGAAPGESVAEVEAATSAWMELFRGDRYPNLARAAQHMPSAPRFDPDAHFEFGLGILLAGLEQRRSDKSAQP